MSNYSNIVKNIFHLYTDKYQILISRLVFVKGPLIKNYVLTMLVALRIKAI